MRCIFLCGKIGASEANRYCAFPTRSGGGAIRLATKIRCPAPDAAPGPAPRGRNRYWPQLEQMATHQRGRSSQPHVGACLCEVVSALRACAAGRARTNGARSANFAQNLRRRGRKLQTIRGGETRACKASSDRKLGHQGPLQLHPGVCVSDLWGTAGTRKGAFRSTIEIARALTRCPTVAQCSVEELHAAAGETGVAQPRRRGRKPALPPRCVRVQLALPNQVANRA